MATTITINDEATRTAVTFALWKHAAWTVGEDLYNELHEMAEQELGQHHPSDLDSETRLPAYEAVALLKATDEGAARIRDAQLGEDVELAFSGRELLNGLDGCVYAVKEDDGLLSRPAAERARLLAVHDAAVRLQDGLRVEAVA
jgi:hypothetical protein